MVRWWMSLTLEGCYQAGGEMELLNIILWVNLIDAYGGKEVEVGFIQNCDPGNFLSNFKDPHFYKWGVLRKLQVG